MNHRRVQIAGKEYFWANDWYDLETYLPAAESVVNRINAFFDEEERKRKEEERKKREEERKQTEYETDAEIAFEQLKKKYHVAGYKDSSPLSRLNRILMEIDSGNTLAEADLTWLNVEKLFPALAFYYGRNGKLASAGSNWRKAKNPQQAIDITEDAKSRNNPVTLTMRGGAFRDLGEMDEAEKCGLKAIKLAPDDFHPYNLLAAVYYQRGLPEEGEKYFERARNLGSRPADEDNNIKSAIEMAGAGEKLRVAEYLLKKDPERYRWARKYIETSS